MACVGRSPGRKVQIVTVALVLGAIALALVVGVAVGALVVGPRLGGSRGAAPATVQPVPAIVHLEAADSPRAVPEEAELREADVIGLTPDGRMTRAGLLGLILRNSETAVAVVDEFRDVVLYNHRAVELGMVRDRLLAEVVWRAAKDVLDIASSDIASSDIASSGTAQSDTGSSGTTAEKRFEFTPSPSTLGFVSTGRATARNVDSVGCLVRLAVGGDGKHDERYAVVYGVDDTEHARVEATRRDFVANVSHELKTPVGAIGLLGEALLESADDIDAVSHFGKQVVGEAARLGTMVNELLSLSRLQSGRTEELSSVDVDELVEEALESAALTADAAGIKLQADAPIGLTIRGDRMLLLTALNNLIVNAIAYSPENTMVSVSRRRTVTDGVPMVSIAVTDRGIGIAPADQQRVFERFFRVDKARSRLTGGTGLGLAIVKHVAANHDGTIALWSKPGTGSTFTLSIPQEVLGPDDGDPDDDDPDDDDLGDNSVGADRADGDPAGASRAADTTGGSVPAK